MRIRSTIAALVTLTLVSGCTAMPGTDLELVLGTMMPLTGALSSIGKQMEEGATMAVDQVNAAGVGMNITVHHEDDRTGDSSAITGTFNRLLAQRVDAVVGPCCSGVTGSVLSLAVDEQVLVLTPSATSPALIQRGPNGEDVNDGFFWRVPPSDAIQARVLARLVSNNSVSSVNMIVVNNAYGNSLADVFQAAFSGSVGTVERFAEQGTNSYSTQVTAACQGDPQGIVLVVYTADGAAILREMQQQGCLSKVKVFASEGVYDEAATLAKDAGQDEQGKWLAAGVKGTTPSTGDLSEYKAMFEARWGHPPLLYSPESYDGVMYVALAALKAQSTDASQIKEHLRWVANAPGVKTSDFKEAARLIAEGQDIDWVGQAHDFTFDEHNEPTSGVYSYWEIDADGKMTTVETGVTA